MRKRGFTLIEILVVIAIIGILASIITTYLSGARNQAKEKAIVSDMTQMRTQMELISNGSNYAGLCNDPSIQRFTSDIARLGGVTCSGFTWSPGCSCSDTSTSWYFVATPSWGTQTYCVSNLLSPGSASIDIQTGDPTC